MAKNLPKKNNGRPTKYDESFCDKMLEFFDIEHTYEVKKVIVDKKVRNIIPTKRKPIDYQLLKDLQ